MRRVQQGLNEALHALMRDDPAVLMIGEDILDPYGGAFKVTKGLSTRFPERVLTTPISEAGIVGLAAGLALRGYKPVVEIMFGDFVTLVADQLINQATKMLWMYNEDVPCSMVVRTPMGGRRGYGPTHSQTLEKHFLGVPGLDVAAVSNVYDPGAVLSHAVLGAGRPVLFIENKLLYAAPELTPEALSSQYGCSYERIGEGFPTVVLGRSEPDVTLVTYGGMVPLTLEASKRLREEEGLECEVVVPHRLSPLEVEPLADAVRRTRRLVVIEEGVEAWGWGAEVVAALSPLRLEAPPQRVGAALSPVPAARALEDRVLPQVEDIVRAAIATVDERYEDQEQGE